MTVMHAYILHRICDVILDIAVVKKDSFCIGKHLSELLYEMADCGSCTKKVRICGDKSIKQLQTSFFPKLLNFIVGQLWQCFAPTDIWIPLRPNKK